MPYASSATTRTTIASPTGVFTPGFSKRSPSAATSDGSKSSPNGVSSSFRTSGAATAGPPAYSRKVEFGASSTQYLEGTVDDSPRTHTSPTPSTSAASSSSRSTVAFVFSL